MVADERRLDERFEKKSETVAMSGLRVGKQAAVMPVVISTLEVLVSVFILFGIPREGRDTVVGVKEDK